ncbi:MAG: AI-2E family transporter, partial [Pseudoxanthomonas sp.]
FGFLGMLLALPMAAVTNVLLRYAHERYTASHLYAGERPSIVLDSYVDRSAVEVAPKDLDPR